MILVLVAAVGEQEKCESNQHSYKCSNRAGVVVRADRSQISPLRHTIPNQGYEDEKYRKNKAYIPDQLPVRMI